jgi:hypothetical protein
MPPPPRARATPIEPFKGIHIGSVEVQILPPPPAPAPATRPAAPPAARTRLARGLTSSIGLRQS